MKTTIAVSAVLLALVAMVNAQASASMGPQVLAVNKETLSGVGERLGKDPIHFVAVIKLKDGADVNKFVAVREAVAKKAQEQYKGVKVAYIKVM
jgi:hypothetical protein